MSACAHANVALIKYWGKKDETLRIPANGSISLNLSGLYTKTTVEFKQHLKQDIVLIDGMSQKREITRVVEHLNRIRTLAKIKLFAKVESQNNFPQSTGLSSSASGFAALTLAATTAASVTLSEIELTILARLASGSACRSIPAGFVQWYVGNSHKSSFAATIFPKNYWDIIDVVAIVGTYAKEVSSSEGQKFASSSPFYKTRLKNIVKKLVLLKKYIAQKNFPKFGELIEAEALELHAIMLTSQPALIYWSEGTLKLMKLVKKWRSSGIPVYFTINTGQNIHLFCQSKDQDKLIAKLKDLPFVKQIIMNKISQGARLVNKHLF